MQVCGRTVAVIGVGRIGRIVCQLAKGLGMQAIGVDKIKRYPREVDYEDLEGATGKADFVVSGMDLVDLLCGITRSVCIICKGRQISSRRIS